MAPTTPSTSPPRQPARRLLVPILGAVALLALVTAVVARLALSRPQPTGAQTAATATTPLATAPLALDPAAYGMACVASAAWSPDSAKVAIIGARGGCAESNSSAYYPAVVAIVSAKDGHRLASLQPDATVLNAFHLQAPRAGAPNIGPDATGAPGVLFQPGISYTGVSWSPDSASVALTFSFAYTGPPAAPRISVSGVYVGSIAGASAGASDGGARAFGVKLSQQLPYVAEWNLKTGAPVVASSALGPAIQGGTVAQLEPASLSYSWRPDGSLAGSGGLTTTNPPTRAQLGPVGVPDGGMSFTVWQGMDVQADTGDPQHPQSAAVFLTGSDFLAWSPDGTYLLSASYAWRAQPSKQPIPSAAQLQQGGAASLPLLPIRDAAMDAMLSPQQGTHPYTFTSSSFTWSPDGKLLAAIADGGARQISADVTVLIVDCASGKTLATLQAGNASTAYGNLASLQWSPNGKALLVGAESEYFIFGPGQTPQA